jgi:phage shock protein PspC (stress-responsive transcriptional regulator)
VGPGGVAGYAAVGLTNAITTFIIPNADLFHDMAGKLYRVVEGRQVSGVCAGLEACGRGTATGWRLLFVFGSFFWLIAIFIYIGMAVSLPLVKTRKEAAEKSGAGLPPGETGPNLEGIESQLSKLAIMKEKGLIDEAEYNQLRKKALDL